jgi:hypothetical protein
MKILNALILLSAALPAFGQIVVDPDYDRSSHGNADPSLGRFGKCPPGDIYIGPSPVTCLFVCDSNDVNNRINRYNHFPMKKGSHCFLGATEGKCDGDGSCILEDKASSNQSPTPSSSTVPTSSSMPSGTPSPSGEPYPEEPFLL